jgi:hypothetical protein
MFRHLKSKFVLAALIACGSAMSSYVYAQSDVNLVPRSVVVNSGDCGEYTKALLDEAVVTEGKDKSFIFITRLGTGERSRKLVRARLYAPSSYLVESRGIPKSRVITAEGERVRGLGHVELYVGGKLWIIFKMERNKNFVSDCRP